MGTFTANRVERLTSAVVDEFRGITDKKKEMVNLMSKGMPEQKEITYGSVTRTENGRINGYA